MADKHPGYMTTFKERLSYWTYFIGQNIYYNITAAFISTYLAMQGVNLAKVAIVLLIVKIWDAVNDPIFGFIFDKVKFKNGQKSLPWLRISTALIPIVTIILFSIPSALGETGKLVWFGVAYVLWDTVYTLTDIPAYAMLNTMTDNLPERNTLLSGRADLRRGAAHPHQRKCGHERQSGHCDAVHFQRPDHGAPVPQLQGAQL